MQKKEPPILVTRPSLPPVEEYEQLVREIFFPAISPMAERNTRSSKPRLRRSSEPPFLRLFTNGHLALEFAIAALKLEPRDHHNPVYVYLHHTCHRPLLRLYTRFLRRGAGFFTLDTAKLEQAITPRTRAILPVHVYGNPLRRGSD